MVEHLFVVVADFRRFDQPPVEGPSPLLSQLATEFERLSAALDSRGALCQSLGRLVEVLVNSGISSSQIERHGLSQVTADGLFASEFVWQSSESVGKWRIASRDEVSSRIGDDDANRLRVNKCRQPSEKLSPAGVSQQKVTKVWTRLPSPDLGRDFGDSTECPFVTWDGAPLARHAAKLITLEWK